VPRRVAAGAADLGTAGPRAARGLKALLARKPALLDPAAPDPEAPVIPPVSVDRTRREDRQEPIRAFRRTEGKEVLMTRAARTQRQPAKVVQLRKSTTLEMVRLACPDAAQATLISESFGLPVLDSDGIRELHQRMIV